MAGARLYALAEHGADVRPELMTVAQRSCAPAASHPCSWVVASHSCHVRLQVGPVRRRHAHDAPEGFEIENEVRWRWPLGPTIGLPPTLPCLTDARCSTGRVGEQPEEVEGQFRKIIGYRQLAKPAIAIERYLALSTTPKEVATLEPA